MVGNRFGTVSEESFSLLSFEEIPNPGINFCRSIGTVLLVTKRNLCIVCVNGNCIMAEINYWRANNSGLCGSTNFHLYITSA